MDWLFLITGILGYSILMFAPGFVWTKSLGYDTRLSLAIATPLSATFVVFSSSLAYFIKVPWGLGWFLVTLLVALLPSLIVLYKRNANRTEDKPKAEKRWFFTGGSKSGVLAFLAGFTVVFTRMLVALKEADTFSQTFDAVFHINLLRLITDSGNAYILQMNLVDLPNRQGFYPAVWHQFVSLLEPTLGSPYIAANAMSIAVTLILFPFTLAGLVWAMFPGDKRKYYIALLVANMLPQASILAMVFGVLYPNHFANAMGLSILIPLLLFFSSKTWFEALKHTLVLVVMAFGIALAHPGVILFMSFGCALVTLNGIAKVLENKLQLKQWRYAALLNHSVIILGFALYVLAFSKLTWAIPNFAAMRSLPAHWDAQHPDVFRAAIRALTSSAGFYFHATWRYGLLLLLLVLVALVAIAVKNRNIWLAYFWGFSLLLYVVASGAQNPVIRQSITGLWYGDANRLAMFLGMSGAILFVLSTDWMIYKFPQDSLKPAVLVPLVVFGIVQLLPVNAVMYERMSVDYPGVVAEDDTGYLLSEEEAILLERLPEEVPEGTVIIGNPWEGTTFAWAMAHREVLFPHVGSIPVGDRKQLADTLNDKSRLKENCAIIEKYNAYYVLDFKNDYLWNGLDKQKRHEKYEGLKYLDFLQIAEVVDEEGFAKLMKITACETSNAK